MSPEPQDWRSLNVMWFNLPFVAASGWGDGSKLSWNDSSDSRFNTDQQKQHILWDSNRHVLLVDAFPYNFYTWYITTSWGLINPCPSHSFTQHNTLLLIAWFGMGKERRFEKVVRLKYSTGSKDGTLMLEEGIRPLSKSLFSDGTTLSLSVFTDTIGSPFKEELMMVFLFYTCSVRSPAMLSQHSGLLDWKWSSKELCPALSRVGSC